MAKTELFGRLKRAIALSSRGENPAPPAERLSRRDFIKASGGAAFGLLLGRSAAGAAVKQALKAAPGGEPVVILGAGAAGLTAAYRLKQKGAAFQLYEASPRFGGRIFTKRGFNSDGMFCELGGELIDTVHEDIMSLAAELGLKIEALAPTAQDLTRNLYYFRGRPYTDKNLVDAIGPLVKRIAADQKEIFGDQPREEVTYRKPFNAAKFDRMTLREYLDSMTEVDRWVREVVDMAYLTEFGLECDKQSALGLLLLMGTKVGAEHFELFGESDEAFRIVGGNSRLPEALAQRLGVKDEGSADYHPGHELVRIEHKAGRFHLTFSTPGGPREISAGQVICTIPFSRLRHVSGIFNLSLSPAKKLSIKEMGYGANSKLMLGFKDRYWRRPDQGVASNGGIFTDLQSQSFWETSRLQKGQKGILTNYTGGGKGLKASSGDIGPALKDLDAIYPGLSARYEGANALFNWSRYRHNNGSYICCLPGQYTSHFGAAGESEYGGQLVFGGEHTSLQWGGYMNGGVATGNAAALEALKRRP